MSERPKRTLFYKKGSVLQLTVGEYSDFRTCGLLVAIQDIDLPKLAQEMTDGKNSYDDGSEPGDFASWLIANGYAMPVDANEVHLGAYGRWEEEFGVQYVDGWP